MRKVARAGAMLLVTAVVALGRATGTAAPPEPEKVVQAQLDAYNAHDIDAFVATYAEDVQLFEHPSKLLATGRAELRERYAGRFRDSILHADIAKRIVVGNTVVDHEKVRRTFPEGAGTIEAVAIYEVQGETIAKAWLIYGPKTLDPGPQSAGAAVSRGSAPGGFEPLLGAWQVVRVEKVRPNGESITQWMGKAPSGLVVYDASGLVSVQLMRDPRPVIHGDDFELATESEKASTAAGYYACFGRYEVDLKTHTVTHRIQGSLRPEEVGIQYTRTFAVSGDRLTLTTPLYDDEGEKRFNRVTAKRVR